MEEIDNEISNMINTKQQFLQYKISSGENSKSTWLSSYMYIDLLLNKIAIDNNLDLIQWSNYAKEYYNNLDTSLFDDFEKIQSKALIYILNLITGKYNVDLITNYTRTLEEYIKNNYKMNKSNLQIYEELIISLIEAQEFNKANIYCDRILEISKRRLIEIINRYIESNKDVTVLKQIRTEAKRILNKTHKNFKDFIPQNFFYIRFYYKELLKVEDIESVAKAIYFGIP